MGKQEFKMAAQHLIGDIASYLSYSLINQHSKDCGLQESATKDIQFVFEIINSLELEKQTFEKKKKEMGTKGKQMYHIKHFQVIL